MRIVVDANIIIAALLGSPRILFTITQPQHCFFAPCKIVAEVGKYKNHICEKTGRTLDRVTNDFEALLEFIIILEEYEYAQNMEKAEDAIGNRDEKDSAYLACALAVNADFIWTDDKDFKSQNLVNARTTDEFVRTDHNI